MDRSSDLKKAEKAKEELELKYEVKNMKETYARYQGK